MQSNSITPRTVRALPPALIIQALKHLDEGGQREISSRLCDLIRNPNAWTRRLSADLLIAIQAEMETQAAEDRWLDREERRQEFELGRY